MSSNDDVHTVEVDLNEWEGVMHERDELRAENEQLRSTVAQLESFNWYEGAWQESQTEVERLRAENERLLGMYGIGIPAEVQRLRQVAAENERLRAEIVRLDDLADDRLMEVERLRAALLHVIDGVGGPDAIGWNTECPTCIAARDLVKPME